jgi:predicted metal-dependent phosphoesterase TrpH
MADTLHFETLHAHTVYSDGLLEHEKVLDICRDNGFSIVAFTDHEAILDQAKFTQLKALNHDVKFISGVELTFNAIDHKPIPKTESGHLIGLFVDPTNVALRTHCGDSQEHRIEKVKKNIRHFNELGFDITFFDVSQEVKGLSYAKPHLVAALIKKEQNQKRIREVLEQMKVASEHDEELKKQYDLIASHDMTRLVYDLFLGNRPFMSARGEDEAENLIDFDEMVKLIRNAGGVSSLAHFFTINGAVTETLLTEMIEKKRLDGFETRYGFYDPEEMQGGLNAQMKHLTELSQKLNCITTGGVDFHKSADMKNILLPGYNERIKSTIGMTDSLLQKHSTVSKEWNTL